MIGAFHRVVDGTVAGVGVAVGPSKLIVAFSASSAATS